MRLYIIGSKERQHVTSGCLPIGPIAIVFACLQIGRPNADLPSFHHQIIEFLHVVKRPSSKLIGMALGTLQERSQFTRLDVIKAREIGWNGGPHRLRFCSEFLRIITRWNGYLVTSSVIRSRIRICISVPIQRSLFDYIPLQLETRQTKIRRLGSSGPNFELKISVWPSIRCAVDDTQAKHQPI